METVSIKVSAEQLKAFEALGLKYELDNKSTLQPDEAPEGYVKVVRDIAPMGKILQYYIDKNQEEFGIAQNLPRYNRRTFPGFINPGRFLIELCGDNKYIYEPNSANDFGLLITGEHLQLMYSNSMSFNPYMNTTKTIQNCNDLDNISKLANYAQLLKRAVKLWVDEFGDEDVYVLRADVVDENEKLQTAIEEVKKENSNIKWYVAHYEQANAERDAAITAKNNAESLMYNMIAAKPYSAWHAYYCLTHVKKIVDYYITARNNRNHRSGKVIVKIREFNLAIDEAIYFFNKPNQNYEPQLLTKLKALKSEFAEQRKELNKLNINIKYDCSNPDVLVNRALAVLESLF